MCLNWPYTVPLNGSHTYKEVTRSPISASQSWGSCSPGIPTGTYPPSRATKLLNQRATASLSLSERPKGSTSHSYRPGSISYLAAVNLSVNNQYKTVLGRGFSPESSLLFSQRFDLCSLHLLEGMPCSPCTWKESAYGCVSAFPGKWTEFIKKTWSVQP